MIPPPEYSAIEHLARICCPPGADWRDVLMGMTAAFDASGDESSQLVMVVAGFISSAKHWEDFSGKWLARLKDDGLSYMHMNEFAHSTVQFANGWKDNRKRREALLGDLMSIIKSHTYRKFGIVVTNDTFRATITSETQKDWHLNAYSLAGRGCAKQVNEWAMEERYGSPIELVFEKGDQGAGKLHHRLVEDGYQAPVFKPKKDELTPEGVLIPAFVPLQAADFLAYEIFLEVTRMIQGSEMEQRWGMNEFENMLGYIGAYEVVDLKELQDMVNLSKRLDEWAISIGLLYRDGKGRLCQDAKVRSCKLDSFTWGRVTSDSGKPMVEPICLQHRSSRIAVDQRGEEVTVTCKPVDGSQHQLGACKVRMFLQEQAQATQGLGRHYRQRL
jgi:hypothetical protein